MVKRIAQINLPLTNNSGESLIMIHDKMQRALCQCYGGYTMTQGQGAWIDTVSDTLYSEGVAIYSVAMDDDETTRQSFHHFAAGFAALAEQICIFVVHANGVVEFVEPYKNLCVGVAD